MARALQLLFAPSVKIAIALSRLVDGKSRKARKGGERRKADRRKNSR